MTDQVPTFFEGDRVRVMQTDEMVRKNFANRYGIIGRVRLDGDYWVFLDGGGFVTISGASLMRELP